MSALSGILKTSKLVTPKTGAVLDLASVKNKYTMLYFSAGWCPPCRGFTPTLAEYYQKHKTAKDFEVIWVSWDEDKEGWESYASKHPWPALSFEDSNANMEALAKKFQVQSIPTLITLDTQSGDIVSRVAREKIPRDPNAEGFPYSNSSAKL